MSSIHFRRYSRIFTLVLGLGLASFSSAEENPRKPLPAICSDTCAAPFGTELGKTKEGVVAYSNCRPDCVYEQPNLVFGTYTGIEWQCVEFARRWLLANKQSVFASVDFAYEIWDKIPVLTNPKTKAELKLVNLPNGNKQAPKAGDLLIYSKEFAGTGHVAVVTKVLPKSGEVWVAEQNNLNQKWPSQYARKVPLVKKGERYWLLDTYLIGWKTIAH